MKKTQKKKNLSPSKLCGRSPEGALAVRELLTRLGDKWSVAILVSLAKHPKSRARFSEIEKMVPGISQKVLTATLREFERDGLVSREVFPQVPPRVEYEITKLGKTMLKPMQAAVDWVGDYWDEVKAARASFDGRD